MWGVLPVQEQRFLLPVKVVHTLETEELLICLATCHSLTIIDNKLTGDPLDLKVTNLDANNLPWLLHAADNIVHVSHLSTNEIVVHLLMHISLKETLAVFSSMMLILRLDV
jgi:hypothetical protein